MDLYPPLPFCRLHKLPPPPPSAPFPAPSDNNRIQGAPQCECIEKMPIVSRADCTKYTAEGMEACDDNDLRTHYEGEMQSPGGDLNNLVGDCPNE